MPGFTLAPVVASSRLRPALAAVATAALSIAGLTGVAHAGEIELSGAVTAAGPTAPGVAAPASSGEENMIPPSVEGSAVPVSGGGYCYGGPHPAPGGGWEAITTPHTHNYAPFDLRLFAHREGCYYFIGDPRDFGYTGQVYNYYGAHPIADTYGGGWCFMVGGHYHWWRPWSPYFTVVGPWFYWYGPYDPFFWAYWPYYSFYYRSYYPNYYAGGRYFRGGYRVAPPITRVPPTGWRGTPPAGSGWRGTPPAMQTSPLRAGSPAGGGWRGAPGSGGPAYGAPGGGWHGGAPNGGAWRGAPNTPSGGAPSGGGWHGGAPSGGGWRGAPSGGGWHGGGFGGGFRGGGGGGTFRGGRR